MNAAAVRAPLKLAIVISGRGSNMLAIARACQGGNIHAQVAIVIGDGEQATGLQAARELGLPTQLLNARGCADKTQFEAALSGAIDASGAGLVVLAGFMRILSAGFCNHYAGRMLNIHPALLPAHKGLHTHQRVLRAGERMHGATVHYVTPELDGGPLLLQARVPVLPDDSESSLSARVQQQEHIIYPEVIGWIASERLVWRDGAPWLDGRRLEAPVQTGAIG